MFITKRHISRRTVLRGVGAAVALPFLEAMAPAATPLGQTAATPRSRFCGIEVVHGCAGSTEWEVIDITIEGASLVKNYRTQFDGIIRQTFNYSATVWAIPCQMSS